MRFMLLTPGTGHFYCGSCLRDNALGKALRALGHDVEVVPLYLPLVLEEPEQEPESDGAAVQMGGINMYLQQKARLARRLPRWLADLLDSPGLLRWAARRGNLTEARDLGAMALSMVQGESGHQELEVRKLIDWVRQRERPDVIVLSNVMLCGVVRSLKRELGVPIVASLQGEAPFLDALPEPFAEQAWKVVRERAAEIDAFVPVSATYGALMAERLGLTPDVVRVVHNGLDLAGWPTSPAPLAQRRPPAIGYMARMCADKGLPTLVDAFVEVCARDRVPGLRLRVAGVTLSEDKPLLDDLRERLRRGDCADRVEFLPNIDRAEKLAFLQTLNVLSVPATYGESFGLYLLEALAAGVPFVQPRHGAFAEILELTGGGVLCEPDDAESLADGLEALLLDEARAQALADRGRAVVRERFTSERMALEFAEVCSMTSGERA